MTEIKSRLMFALVLAVVFMGTTIAGTYTFSVSAPTGVFVDIDSANAENTSIGEDVVVVFNYSSSSVYKVSAESELIQFRNADSNSTVKKYTWTATVAEGEDLSTPVSFSAPENVSTSAYYMVHEISFNVRNNIWRNVTIVTPKFYIKENVSSAASQKTLRHSQFVLAHPPHDRRHEIVAARTQSSCAASHCRTRSLV